MRRIYGGATGRSKHYAPADTGDRILGRAPIVQTLGIVAAVATAAQAGALIALHVLPTGYNPRRDAVSDYGIGRFEPGFGRRPSPVVLACLALRHCVR